MNAMSPSLTTPIDTASRGLARDFIRRAGVEFGASQDQLTELLKPVLARLDRYPDRQLRPGQLDALVAQWRRLPSMFQLSLIHRDGRNASVTDIRLGAAKMHSYDWEDETITELALSIEAQMFSLPQRKITRRGGAIRTIILAHVGLHALARHYQRCRDQSDDLLLTDLMKLALVGIEKIPQHEEGSDEVAIPCPGGSWRGHISMVESVWGNDHREVWPAIAVRTFIDKDESLS
jgi:hypothetical protein